MTKANREYKDSMFRIYFSDEEKLRDLYSALTGKSCGEIETIDIKTLEKVMYGRVKNDLAFLANHQIIVIGEHMSSFSENMPVRELRYYVEILETIIDVKELFGRKRIGIPAPEFYVFYNGGEKRPKEEVLKLSDAFLTTPDGQCSMELKVKIININYDAGHELLEKCRSIREYAHFVHKVREFRSEGWELSESMKKTIEYCKNNEIMLDFLQKHGKEVNKMELGITWEDLKEVVRNEAYEDGFAEGKEAGHAVGRAEGHEEGRAEGVNTEKIRIARNLKCSGIPIAVIVKNTGLSEKEVEAL